MPHIHKLYDFTVSAFIIHEGKILLLHHKKLGTWLQPGGHIELDEDPEEALYREVFEETGLSREQLTLMETSSSRPSAPDSKNLPLPFDMNVHRFGNDPIHKHIDLSYILRAKTDVINQNVTESNKLQWFSKKDIEVMKNKLLPDIYERALFVLQRF